jgi:hypothetical protein
MATALIYSPLLPDLGPDNIALTQSASYTRAGGTDFRHLGSAVDMELVLTTYAFVSKPLTGGTYPPPGDPLDLPFSGYYVGSSTSFIYSSVSVPEASDLVWDGQWTEVIGIDGAAVSADDRIGPLRARVAKLLEDPELTPSYTIPLNGSVKTTILPALDSGDYYSTLNLFLEKYYSSRGIPKRPFLTDLKDLLVAFDFPAGTFLPRLLGTVVLADPLVPQETTTAVSNSAGFVIKVLKGEPVDFNGSNFTQEKEVILYQTEYTVSQLFPALGVLGTLPPIAEVFGLARQAAAEASGPNPTDYTVALPEGLTGNLTAVLSGDYFVKWVFLVRKSASTSLLSE